MSMDTKTKGGMMIKRTITLLMVSIGCLLAQDNFLQGVKAEDLMLDRIEAPSVVDTVGINDRSKFFFNIQREPVSPDGKFTAVVKTKGKYANGIWLTNLATRKETHIDEYGMMPQWSPSGHLVAFIRHGPLPGVFDSRGHQLYGGDELWVCTPSGTKKKNLTPDLQCAHFLWSADNQHVVFDYWNPATDEPFTLAAVDVTTGEIKIIDTGSPYNGIGFAISHDGKMVVYCKSLKWELIHEWWVTDAEIFIANIDGTGKTQITETKTVERLVKWSTEGKSLIVEQHGPNPTDFSFSQYVKILLKKVGG
jgi:Tol biopolymer transport system component